jgi:hypothetical protein
MFVPSEESQGKEGEKIYRSEYWISAVTPHQKMQYTTWFELEYRARAIYHSTIKMHTDLENDVGLIWWDSRPSMRAFHVNHPVHS